MPATEVCATEDFVAEATPQSGSLEDAASTQEILIQQVEGYLNRMREAMCNDLTSLQVQLDACNCEPNGGAGLPWTSCAYRTSAFCRENQVKKPFLAAERRPLALKLTTLT